MRWARWGDESGLEFQYLDMHAGDCLVFNKRSLHLSDPRPSLSGHPATRLALNFRVVIRGKDEDTIPYYPGFQFAKIYPAHSGLKYKALKYAKQSGQYIIDVPLSRFDMIDMLKSPP